MTAANLLPCPFCGSPAKFNHCEDGFGLIGAGVGCMNCTAEVGLVWDVDQASADARALAIWNLRAPSEQEKWIYSTMTREEEARQDGDQEMAITAKAKLVDDPAPLRAALGMAVSLIVAYRSDIRTGYEGLDLYGRGFCQGEVYQASLAMVLRKLE